MYFENYCIKIILLVLIFVLIILSNTALSQLNPKIRSYGARDLLASFFDDGGIKVCMTWGRMDGFRNPLYPLNLSTASRATGMLKAAALCPPNQ